ncbi:hypothetical protein E3T37_00690 [Cryobacterium sp. TMT2-10]|uniref:OmpA family protein n=1 Tax=Cryobacterium sp. TMT2-10 TaxID=1259244 RepID=UPI00106A29BE|nr:OmpA family protein [Cryobacterium sp. TMT2-10]TFD43816.1 hypothetical protein E3T37_00690 [Cryobacterium sp. TMT2-10]
MIPSHLPLLTRTLKLVALFAGLAVLAGCSAEKTIPEVGTDGLMIVVSAHSNVSAANIPAELEPILDAAIRSEAPIAIIGIDGTPEVSWSSGDYEITGANPTATQEDVDAMMGAVTTMVRGVTADSDGANLAQGVRVAHDMAKANASSRPQIIVIDSGLPDTGAIDMTAPGMTLADPAEVSAAVVPTGLVPDLKGASMFLVGFGYSVAPQPPLSPAQTNNVTGIWSTVFADAGAAVTVIPVPRSADGPATAFTTRTVVAEVSPVINVAAVEPIVFGEGSSLGFQPGLSDFRYGVAAATTLDEIAASLLQNPNQRVHILGTAAGTDTIESQVKLATERAHAVRNGLIGRGIDASRIEAIGVGTQWDGYVYDVRPDGTLDPGLAASNRTVQITFPTS